MDIAITRERQSLIGSNFTVTVSVNQRPKHEPVKKRSKMRHPWLISYSQNETR
jgi:hypothetical protein